MIVSSGKFAGVSYEIDASDVTGEVTQVVFDNPTDNDRIIKISQGDLNWSYTMVRKSNGTVSVDPGMAGDACTVALE